MTSSPFLNDIRRFMRTRGYSIRTEKAYVYWIRFFIRYQKLKHPKDMGAAEVVQFLGFLTNDRHVSVNTQKLALNALALEGSELKGFGIECIGIDGTGMKDRH